MSVTYGTGKNVDCYWIIELNWNVLGDGETCCYFHILRYGRIQGKEKNHPDLSDFGITCSRLTDKAAGGRKYIERNQAYTHNNTILISTLPTPSAPESSPSCCNDLQMQFNSINRSEEKTHNFAYPSTSRSRTLPEIRPPHTHIRFQKTSC